MGKNKKNSLKRERNQKAKLKRQRRKRLTLIIAFAALIIAVTVVAIIVNNPPERVFKYDKGAYIDPDSGKTYCPADTSAYLIRTEFYKSNYYGKMDGDRVYTIPGVKNKSWLVRKLTDDLYQLYYEESVTLPTISEFEAAGLFLFIDSPLIINREEITDKTKIDSIVSLLTNGEKLEKIEGATEIYSIRFVSEKYGHMYFCFEYVMTENGSYFYDHLSFSYIKSNGILDEYAASLKENSGE